MDVERIYSVTNQGGRQGMGLEDGGANHFRMIRPEADVPLSAATYTPELLLAAAVSASVNDSLLAVLAEAGEAREGVELTCEVGGIVEGDETRLAVTVIASIPALEPERGRDLLDRAIQRAPMAALLQGRGEFVVGLPD